MWRRQVWTAILAVSLVPAWACGTTPATPATGEDDEAARFFVGRTITYLVASQAGGGFDTYARIIARYLERHLPGTRVVVRNASGARHLVGTNETYNAAPDGLTIGTFMVGGVYPQLAGGVGVRYDLGRMSWIGNAASEPRALAVTTRSGVQSLDDVRNAAEPVSIVTGAVGSTPYFAVRSLGEALGLNFRLVTGFNDNEGDLAMVRGDVAGTLTSSTSLQPYIDKGLVRVILRLGGSPTSDDHVPHAEVLAASERGRRLMYLLEQQGLLARTTAGPPDIPAERLALLRRAYGAALADPDLRAEFARIHLPIEPLDADTVAAHIRRMLDQPPDVVDWLRSIGSP
jgi:tripartite-type tricarboxylate transporter receptor subunit TctC